MLAIEEITRKPIDTKKLVRGIVSIVEDDEGSYVYEFGYFKKTPDNILFFNINTDECYPAINANISKDLMFSTCIGYYIIRPKNRRLLLRHSSMKGCGNYPYFINKEYEAVKNFDEYQQKQQIDKPEVFEEGNYLHYSFGVEFETCCGYVPVDRCMRDGLIPLRDGSITGIEYSTVVLCGNEGLNLLKQQCNDLKKYTEFNKDCALHIHFGGYPLKEKEILFLYKALTKIQYEIKQFIPRYSYETHEYKTNGKDYCLPIEPVTTFDDLYYKMSDCRTKYMGDLFQGHPNDIERERKWNIASRYHNFNFVNLLFYDCCKTLELRFLRPSFNFNKILTWIMIFNGVLSYCENEAVKYKMSDIENPTFKIRDDLASILQKVYPYNVCQKIFDTIVKMKIAIDTQNNAGDYIGLLTFIEDSII